MRFAKIVFWIAGIWGILVLTPLYFIFEMIGRQDPPPITHPAFYYGFVGTALVWQLAFFVIATNPARFRPFIIPSILEKFTYVTTLIVLHWQGRLHASDLIFAAADGVLGVLFVVAFVRTARLDNRGL